MDQKEFERRRLETIEMLNPGFVEEMRGCAQAMEMTFEEFFEHLRRVVEDKSRWGYYVGVGANESYRNYDWDKIWAAYELITGKPIPPTEYGRYPGSGFSCSC